jgi:hypothetical protein
MMTEVMRIPADSVRTLEGLVDALTWGYALFYTLNLNSTTSPSAIT